MIMKKTLLIITTVTYTLITLTSCKKYLDINSDPSNPQTPSCSSVLPAMLSAIPRGIQWDARYLGKYTQNWGAATSGDTWDQMGYLKNSDAGGDIWRQTYYGLGANLEYMIKQGLTKGQYDYVGASYALKAYMFQIA